MDFVEYSDRTHPLVARWTPQILLAAAAANVPSCALAAIVQLESKGANVLEVGKEPGPGCGVGLGQITFGVDWSDLKDPCFEGLSLLDPASNLKVAAGSFLAPAIAAAARMQSDFPDAYKKYGDGQLIYYAFAAYNAGEDAVRDALREGEDPDVLTTDGYAARATHCYLHMIAQSHRAASAPA